MPYAVIVAGTDFSAGGDAAVGEAAEIARRHGARLVVAYVVPPLVAPSPLVDDLMISQATMGVRENLRASGDGRSNPATRKSGRPGGGARGPGWRAGLGALRAGPPQGGGPPGRGRHRSSGLARVVFGSVASAWCARPPARC